MNLTAADFYMTRFASQLPGALKLLGDLETDWLDTRLRQIEIDRPVFIAGLARSGTTILLNVIASLPGVATHRYRDFPFLFVPWAWNKLQNLISRPAAAIERAHRDGIWISKESPDAFEEPIWSHFFPGSHEIEACHLLTAADARPEFDEFFRQHLRKILLLRQGSRYVSKCNYNVTRLEYLDTLFPDARYLIPVRHPVAHVESLVRQHRLFTQYSEQDARVPVYMRAAGHYEFGPQRVPVNVDMDESRRVLDAWRGGRNDLGYAALWRSVYRHLSEVTNRSPNLASRMMFVPHEDLCREPVAVLKRLFEFCGLPVDVETPVAVSPPHPGREGKGDGLGEAAREEIWQATAAVAGAYGYVRTGRA